MIATTTLTPADEFGRAPDLMGPLARSTTLSLDALLPIFDELGLGVLLMDSRGHVQAANHAGVLMLGATYVDLSRCPMHHRGWELSVRGGTSSTANEFGELLRAGGDSRQPIGLRFRNKQGRLVRARLVVVPRTTSRGGHAEPVTVIIESPATGALDEAGDPDTQLSGVLVRLQMALHDLAGLGSGPGSGRALPDSFRQLSDREAEILSLLLAGVRVSTIAEHLYLSQHTVRNHLRSMFRKVGVSSQAELIRMARGLE